MPQQMQMTEEQQKALQEKIKKMSPEELKEFQKQQCIFCQIIAGKVPSKKIFEDDKTIAILDINPAAQGHILLLPKEHYAIMPQVLETEIGHLFSISKKLSQAMLRGLKVSGTNLFIANGFAAGQKAQHFMIHIIPRKEGDGILNLQERIIDERAIQGAKITIETKLKALLGVKPESPPEKKRSHPKSEEPKTEERKKELKEHEEEIASEKKGRKEEKVKAIKMKKAEQKKEFKGKNHLREERGKTKENISLDDIARLFH